MASNSTVPQPTFGPNGFVAPTEQAIDAAVAADINAAFGGGLNPAPETPQGQLAASMAAAIGNKNDLFLWDTQQADPAYAEGRRQDAMARIYFIERNGAEPTVVLATCSGLPGVTIPVGAVAVAQDGNLYVCTQEGTISLSGTVVLTFECATLGPISCPAGSLDQIYRAVNGWDSVSNAADGVIGRNTENRVEFEERRFQSVAKNSLGSLPSVLGSVLAVPNVLDAYVTENFTASPLTIGGVALPAHSIYVAVAGGAAADVAKAIWTKKAPGCDMAGNTTVTVYDTSYDPPYPSYAVKFEIPDPTSIIFKIDIVNNAQVPSDGVDQIRAAIIAAFAGADGGTRARIGSTIYASRFYGTVAALGAWAQIISIKIGSKNTDAAQVTGFIDDGTGGGSPSGVAGLKMTVTAVAGGALAVGQTVVGDSVVPGTEIEVQDSGTPGGIGVYSVSMSQTTISETLYGVLADQDKVVCQIDQAPTIAAANIAVTLT